MTKPVLEVFNWFQTAPGGETRKLSSYESSPNSVRNNELGVLGTVRCGGPNAVMEAPPPPSRRPPNSFEPCGLACIVVPVIVDAVIVGAVAVAVDAVAVDAVAVVEPLVLVAVFVDVLSGGDKVARKDRRSLLALDTVVWFWF